MAESFSVKQKHEPLMKEIKAYIRKDKLDLVMISLARIEGLSGVSVCSISGFGRSRGILQLVDFSTHIKLEAVCDDALKDTVVATILRIACSGRRGDGKVYVSTIDEAHRIETGSEISETT